MISDYAKELAEHLDRLAELVPENGPGSRRLKQLPLEDRKYIGDKARAAERALMALQRADLDERLGERVERLSESMKRRAGS